MLQQIDARVMHLEKVDADVREWEKKTAKSAEAELKSRAAQIASELGITIMEKTLPSRKCGCGSNFLQAIVDALKSKFKGPIFLAGTRDGSVALVYVRAAPRQNSRQTRLIQQDRRHYKQEGGQASRSARGAGKDASKIDGGACEAREVLS